MNGRARGAVSGWQAIVLIAAVAVVVAAPCAAFAGSTGGMTGSIVDSSTGGPLVGAEVVIAPYLPEYSGYGATLPPQFTDENGHYGFSEIATGSYMVYVDTLADTHQPTYCPGTPNSALLQRVEVSADTTSEVATFGLRPYAHIDGHVERKLTGDPVSGIGVTAFTQVSPGMWAAFDSASTDASGNYSLRHALAGSYHLGFHDDSGIYCDAMYPGISENALQAWEGTTVTVASDGTTLTVGDMPVVKLGRITVNATDFQTGNPVAWFATTSLRMAGATEWNSTWEQVLLEYVGTTFVTCPPGDYRVRADALGGGYMNVYYGGTTFFENATILPVTDGEVYDLTIPVFTPSTVSGRVTSSESATGIANAHVDVFALQGGEWLSAGIGTTADSTGTWSLPTGPGVYRFRFSDPAGLLPPSYFTGGLASADASDVAVGIETAVTGVDQALYPDDAAPVTMSTVSPPAAASDWSSATAVYVSLSATDQAGGWGVDSTWFSVGSELPTATYVSPVTVTADGATTVWFGSIDRGGNREQALTTTVYLDHTAPTLTRSVKPVAGSATVSLAASDPHSGVAAIQCRVDGGAETAYSASLRLWPGTHKVVYYAVDRAGNRSPTITYALTVLKAAPRLTTPVLSPAKPTHGKSFTISGRITTSDSTNKAVVFAIERKVNGKWKPYTKVLAVLLAGKTSYSAKRALSKTGSYRVSSSHAADSRHLSGVSPWRTFSVK